MGWAVHFQTSLARDALHDDYLAMVMMTTQKRLMELLDFHRKTLTHTADESISVWHDDDSLSGSGSSEKSSHLHADRCHVLF